MYKRELAHKVTEKLTRNPAVAILGSRQVGKTTLALEIAKGQPSIYLDLENPEDIQKLRDPAHYLGLHADKLVILDEIQRYPDLFMSLRGVIDAGRREGKGNGRFLVLEPASTDLLKQSSESLAGRINYSELPGLNPFEIVVVGSQRVKNGARTSLKLIWNAIYSNRTKCSLRSCLLKGLKSCQVSLWQV